MTRTTHRYDRNVALFGAEGQRRLRAKSVTIVGLGGVGSKLVPDVALLGVGKIVLIDHQELAETDRNRSAIARIDDTIPGSLKVSLAARLIREIDPTIEIVQVPHSLISEEGFAAACASDVIFGCVDHDGVRFVLNELAVAYERPLVDLATDVPQSGVYGGRVFFGLPGEACMVCMRLLDMDDVRRFFLSERERDAEDAIYGIPKRLLGATGPAVAPINGVVAGLAATEFMVWATGMRAPNRLLTYYAYRSVVRVSRDEPVQDCYYCRVVRGQRGAANLRRYLFTRGRKMAA